MTPGEKKARYREIITAVRSVLEGETDTIAQMATVSSMLAAGFPDRFFWTGFYRVDVSTGADLVVGPYQGSLGCLRIPFGRGVCGTVAQTGKAMIVPDVHALENHIACDSRSNSEIVIPVRNGKDRLIAVLDIDSTQYAAFDETDQRFLEELINSIFA